MAGGATDEGRTPGDEVLLGHTTDPDLLDWVREAVAGATSPEDRQRRAGAAAESDVHEQLVAGLPTEFRIYRGLKLRPHLGSEADIDHVVIGPTGVVALETKLYAGDLRYRARGAWERGGAGGAWRPAAGEGRPDEQLRRNIADLTRHLQVTGLARARSGDLRVAGALVFAHPTGRILRPAGEPAPPFPLLRPAQLVEWLQGWPPGHAELGGPFAAGELAAAAIRARAPADLEAWRPAGRPQAAAPRVLTGPDLRCIDGALAVLERDRLDQGLAPGAWWGRALVGLGGAGTTLVGAGRGFALRVPASWRWASEPLGGRYQATDGVSALQLVVARNMAGLTLRGAAAMWEAQRVR